MRVLDILSIINLILKLICFQIKKKINKKNIYLINVYFLKLILDHVI